MSQQQRRTLLVLIGWLASRVPLYLMTTGHLWAWYGRKSIGDIAIYLRWVHGYLTHGTVPLDHSWQYPPLVAPLLLLPKLLPGADYQGQFVRAAFIADAAVILILLWTARRRGSWLGPWYWIIGVPVLGPLIYGRFDVFSAVFVVAALALVGKGVAAEDGTGRRVLGGRRWAAGVLAGLGTAIKIWPGLTLFGLPRSRRGWQTIAAAVAAAAGASLLCTLAFRNSTWFLHNQGGRGLEIESIWAIPFLAAKRLGIWHGRVKGHFGSLEVLGPGVNYVTDLALLSTVVVFALLGWWWWRKQWRPAVAADATLVATMLMIITSRVLSPQYLIWLLAVASFCLLSKDTSQRRSALLILLSLPISQWIFPYNFNALIHGHAGPVLALIVRDGLLLAATAIGFLDLWRDTVSGPFLPWRGRDGAVPEQSSVEVPAEAAVPVPAEPEPEAGLELELEPQTAPSQGTEPAEPVEPAGGAAQPSPTAV